MRNRTVAVILAVTGVLFFYILFFEKDTMTTAQQKARSENVFFDLRADLVSEITLKKNGKETKLVRTLKSDNSAGGNLWKMVKPVNYAADELAVRDIISSMDFLLAIRKIKSSDNRELLLNKFGFKHPKLSGSVKFGDKSIKFTIGNDTEDGYVYLLTNKDRQHIYVVERDFRDVINRDSNEFKNRGIFNRNIDEIKAVTIKKEGSDILNLKLDSTKWFVDIDGLKVQADVQIVKELLTGLKNLKAEKFIKPANIKLKKMKLLSPEFIAEITLKNGQIITINKGASCGDDTVYISADNNHSVQTVSDDIVRIFSLPAKRYGNKRPALFKNREIKNALIIRNDKKLSLKSDSAGLWSAGTLSQKKTDQGRVTAFFENFCRKTGDDIITDKNIVNNPGREIGRIKVTLLNGSENSIVFYEKKVPKKVPKKVLDTTDKIESNKPDRDHMILARRDQEPCFIAVERNIMEGFNPDELEFRTRTIKNADKKLIEKIIIKSASSQSIVKQGDSFVITEPCAAVADAHLVHSLIEMIAETQVENFVSTVVPTSINNKVDKGFDRPFAKITGTFINRSKKSNGTVVQTKSVDVTLTIGNLTENSLRYGRIEGKNFIFTLPQSFWKPLSKPLASLRALRIKNSDIHRIEIKTADRTLDIENKNDQWKSSECNIDSDEVERLIIDFANIKGISAEKFAESVGNINVSVTLYRADNKDPAVIEFGEENGSTVLAKRTDIDVLYFVPIRFAVKLKNLCK